LITFTNLPCFIKHDFKKEAVLSAFKPDKTALLLKKPSLTL
jgi:hypothetical protein